MKSTKVLTLLLGIAFIIGCARVPISNRKQVNMMPESDMIAMSIQAYDEFLSVNKVVNPSNSQAKTVIEVGEKIAANVEKYLDGIGQSGRYAGFQWEFNLVDDPTVNAWCMPGGKVVVYTGIMDVAEDDAGLAVIMGHEIAHAVARHGNERMSQQMLIQAGGATLSTLMDEKPQMAQELFLLSYGVGTGLGSLAYSRNHESEADMMGLVFMAMSGYHPEAAPKFWERMSASGGAAPPEFLSTHPSPETRVADLKAYIPEAMKYYNP